VVIALIIALPLTALIVAGMVLYGVYMGLKWNHQMSVEKRAPDPPIAPVKEFDPFQRAQEKAKEMLGADVYNEWINGPEEKEGE
jgi:flagellar basal body-associated protein FliL